MAESCFDEPIATRYELLWPELFEPAVVDATVSFLVEQAASGPALEFGVGTGRIAIPLSRQGVPVHGIELSPAMVAQLRAQPDGHAIEVTIGDFANATVDRRFTMVYLLRNTITNLTTQDEQINAFANAAAHLQPGGRFVIENYVPELRRLPPGETTRVFAATPTHLGFEHYDVAAQIAVSHHWWTIEDHPHHALLTAPLRMARRTGPHGAAGRNDPARAMGRLAPVTLHQREPQPHLRMAETTAPLTISFILVGVVVQPRARVATASVQIPMPVRCAGPIRSPSTPAASSTVTAG